MILYTVINFSVYVFYVLFYLSFFVLVKKLPDKEMNKKMLFYGFIALVCHLASNLLPQYISESIFQLYYVRYLILLMLLEVVSILLFILVLAYYLPYQIKTFRNELLNSYAKRIQFWAYFMLLSLLIALAGVLGTWFDAYQEILMNTVQIQNLIIQASLVGFFDIWFCVYRAGVYLKNID